MMRSVKTKTILLFFVLSLFLVAAGLNAQETLPEIKFEKYRLPNGLEVILHVDKSIPVVTVNVWYHVGSKNEKKGRTGFAHLFEHLMFEGSEHIPNFDKPMERIGGTNNGSTTEDRTNYWENLPSNYLELGLWLEADRLGFLLPVMSQEKLDTQRGVVQNEKRQAVDNQPYGKSEEILLEMLYPSDHPYSWSVIGSLEDLSAATLEDVKEFFKTHYTTNNASLCIAGDFDPLVAKELVAKHFGPVAPGPALEKIKHWVPEINAEKRIRVTDDIELARLYMAWHTPPHFAPGDAEFDLLSNILSEGKTSRLYKALVYDREIAQDVQTYQASREIGSTFHIVVTARKGHTLEEIEKAVDEEMNRILADGVSPNELAQAKTNWEASFIRGLERVGGFGGKADRLNMYNVMLGDPDRFQWDFDRYAGAEADDILRYARRYLDPKQRVVVSFVPKGDLTAEGDDFDRTAEPTPMPEPSFTVPDIQQSVLSNGLKLYLVEDHKLPLVQVNLVLRSGWAADPAGKPGVAALTADLLDEGTRKRTALQIAEEVKTLGAFLGTGSRFDLSNVNLNILKSRVDAGLGLMADVVLNPVFPEEELNRKKKIYLGRIQQESRQPFTSAIKLFLKILYGQGHPYAQPYTGSGTASSIHALARVDLEDFYKANYVPNNAAVVVVGDMTMEEAREKIGRAFAKWNDRPVADVDVPDPSPLKGTKIYILDKPGAAQSVLVMGRPGLKRSNPDFIACQVVNNALGGMFTSRLNMNLREEKAYTYGARSMFMSTRGVGPFLCFTQVQTKFTKESIHEMVKELRDISGTRPLAGDELESSKGNLIKGFPQDFQSFRGIASQLSQIYGLNLSRDTWRTYVESVRNVSAQTALHRAQQYIQPDPLLIVVVGDRKVIEAGIRELGLGEIVQAEAVK